jgi:hypothetical protein
MVSEWSLSMLINNIKQILNTTILMLLIITSFNQRIRLLIFGTCTLLKLTRNYLAHQGSEFFVALKTLADNLPSWILN